MPTRFLVLSAVATTWCAEVAAEFRTHQRTNPFNPLTPEEECVRYVLAALTEGGCPATASVLQSINRIRAAREAT
jgi:hypothetical protein